MKILQFGRFYPPSMGGTQQVMYEQSEGLAKKGYECDVLCSNTEAKYIEDQYDGYKVFRTRSYGMLLSTSITPQLIYKLYKLAPKYDIIHVHAPDPMAFLAIFIVRPKTKVIIHWHSDIVRQQLTRKLFLPLQNWVLKFANKVLVTSDNYLKYSPCLREFLDKSEVIPLGVSNDTFIANSTNVCKIKEQYKNKKIILAVGRIVSYKGFHFLAKSARYLGDDFIILIAGKGQEEERIRDIISKYNLDDKVKLLGFISEEEKYNYLEACDIFCLPSITKAEAFGLAITEAMAFAKPIVSTNIKESGISWLNEDGKTGIQVDVDSPKQLANAFKKLTNNKKIYDEMCKNAKQRYEELFTSKKMIESLIKFYKVTIK
jgi:rhamnosyl/mannosyltransferase